LRQHYVDCRKNRSANLVAGNAVFAEIAVEQAREPGETAVFEAPRHAARTFPSGPEPRLAALALAMPVPDCETSTMRQVMLIPFGIVRRSTGLSRRQ
jgi:hypothetical protein